MAYLSGHNSGHSTVIEGKKSQNRGISETERNNQQRKVFLMDFCTLSYREDERKPI